MARQRTTSRLGQLLSRFANYMASWLWAQELPATALNPGPVFDEVQRKVMVRFTDLDQPAGAVVTETGRQQRIAGIGFTKYSSNRRIPLSKIPCNPDLNVGFRYIVREEFLDPESTNPGSIDSRFRTFVIDSPTNLTRGELEVAAQDMARAALSSPQYFTLNLVYDADYARISDVSSAERNC